jgi:hypothetical protein
MYGLGYGLGKMMEGATSGMVSGSTMAYKDKIYNQQRQDQLDKESDSRQFRDDQAQFQKDQAESAAKYRDEQAEFSRGIQTLNTAYHIAKDSPNPTEVFKAVQERLNPGSDTVGIEFGEGPEPEVSLSYPGSSKGPGFRMTGRKEVVGQILDMMHKNPSSNMEILKKAVELGVTKIDQVDYVPHDKAGGGLGGRSGAGSGSPVKAPKVSEYMAGIKGVGSKYKIDAGNGLTFDESGSVSVNPGLFNAGKETAYSAIKRVIKESKDPVEKAEAEADLKKIQFWYTQIDRILGGPGVAVPPSAGSTVSDTPAGDGYFGRMMAGGSPGGSDLGPVQAAAEIPGLPGIREMDVDLAMKKYNMTRDAVINELKRRRIGK